MAVGIDLNWGGAERRFLYTLDLLKALEERCDAGPAWIKHRLGSGQWKICDVVETIRFGLEGGGMDKDAARKLVATHFKDNKIGSSVLAAFAIITDAIYDEVEVDQGEAKAAAE